MGLLPAGTGAQIIGAGITKILSGSDYKRAKKMQRLQIAGQKELTEFNRKQQLQMWKDTNYGPQVEEMKKAGINVGLMYGMGGGGGATAQVASGHVDGQQTKDTRADQGMGMQLGLQAELLKAQKENIEADTENKKADTTKKAGVETELGKAQTASLTQGIENQKAVQALTEMETKLQTIRTNVEGQTAEDAIRTAKWGANKLIAEVEAIGYDNKIAGATIDEKISIIKAEALGAVLENQLKEAQITLTQQEKYHVQAEMTKLVNDTRQNDLKIAIEKFRAEMERMYPTVWQSAGGIIERALDAYYSMWPEDARGKNKKPY